MKNVSENFKQAIKKYGRQIDVLITYRENGTIKFLDSDTLFSVTPITNGNILKSVMKQLNFESSVKVPKDTIINFKFGVLVDSTLKVEDINEMKVDRVNNLKVNQLATLNGFEYINFGKYVVSEEPEYNADTLSYNHKCYDKLIYSMKDYEDLGITYPITVKNYLIALANKIGLEVENTTFYNENKNILNELYLDTDGNSLGYKYRDVLDEIAQATGSIICISDDDKIEVRYLTETNETIDEDYLKDIDVTMNERYGAVNCVVLSRSAGADNIYYPDPVPENPVTIKIQDNQIMNFNNRSEFLPELYTALNGINYYVNDFKSTGICYLEIGDKYNLKIGENTYNCVLLNDEIDITQGLEEQIHTDMPEQGETDFSKASKTDLKINQTNLIVDKQNQRIEGIISQIGDRSEKTTTITADIDGIESKVEDLEDLTRDVSGIHSVTISDAYPNSNILELHIYGNNSVFDYLYPQDDLFPRDDLYPYGDSRIRFYNDLEDRTIELGILEVLRANSNARDEVFIDYEGNVSLIRRINQNGTTKNVPETTVIGKLNFMLQEGNNTFEVVNYDAPIEIKYAIKSTYTEIFATRIEMDSEIEQTAQEIDLSVNKKLKNYSTTEEMNAQIEITAEEINSEVRKKVGNDEVISKINQSAEAVGINANKINLSANDVINLLAGNTINLASKNIQIKADDILINNNGMSFTYNNSKVGGFQTEEIEGDPSRRGISMTIENSAYYLGLGKYDSNGVAQQILVFYNTPTPNHDNAIQIGNPNWNTYVTIHNDVYVYGYLSAATLVNRSLESLKKDIEKVNFKAIDEIKNTDIYSYKLKEEKENTKKHLGVIIGRNYKCSDKILNEEKDGIELYSMISVAYKAIQEQQEQIEQLQKEIKELKGGE